MTPALKLVRPVAERRDWLTPASRCFLGACILAASGVVATAVGELHQSAQAARDAAAAREQLRQMSEEVRAMRVESDRRLTALMVKIADREKQP